MKKKRIFSYLLWRRSSSYWAPARKEKNRENSTFNFLGLIMGLQFIKQ